MVATPSRNHGAVVNRSQMHPWFAEALDVLWPVDCASCQAPAKTLCETCLAQWQPETRDVAGMPVTVLGSYENGLRAAVLASKEHGAVSVTKKLASRLATVCPETDAVVSVPASASGLRKRGFHAVATLTSVVARKTSSRRLSLRFQSGGQTVQKQRDEQARRTADRHMIGPLRLKGLRAVVIDDVVTTGATLKHACNAVRDAGGEVVGILALAHTPRRSGLG